MFKKIFNILVDKKIPTLAGSLTFFLVLNGGSFLFLYIIISNYLPYSFLNFIIELLDEGDFKDLRLRLLVPQSLILKAGTTPTLAP